ncbi:response regulator transcription factor [Bacillota bacterium Meth-B3]|nr:response regulator transcription factor [Christensenellaceae bacterium]MEA5066057.1 response regulator transcription factor [Eubacteriales bacterium]MEA5069069.1 response regulator transcription factor [Christensenellaceae bacterium]
MKVLIVDDEPGIRTVIREYVEFEGFEADEARDGMEAVEMCRANDYDIVIMDAMMPRLDGFSASKQIRKEKDIPVLMLSARGEEYDKLFGFEMGADDYVVKPFSPKELMARIHVIVKRHQAAAGCANKEEGAGVLAFQGLRIDTLGRSVSVGGQKADLTPKEYDLLIYLVQNKGIALTREQILSAVWGYDYYGDDRTVDAQVKLLRGNLGPYRDYIVTLRGVGYKFEV